MKTTKSTNRIYLVGHGKEVRLVRAAHRAQAVGHVARSLINVKVASQDELVTALGHGIAIESAAEQESGTLFDGDEHEAQDTVVTTGPKEYAVA